MQTLGLAMMKEKICLAGCDERSKPGPFSYVWQIAYGLLVYKGM